jgi:hypothetical protein
MKNRREEKRKNYKVSNKLKGYREYSTTVKGYPFEKIEKIYKEINQLKIQ